MAQEQEKVIWTSTAKEEYRRMADYLYEIRSEAHAERFADALAEMLQRLVQHPRIGKASLKMPALRRVLVKPHTALYYSIAEDHIVVINLKDTRQDDAGWF